jgi:hypothetical protein
LLVAGVAVIALIGLYLLPLHSGDESVAFDSPAITEALTTSTSADVMRTGNNAIDSRPIDPALRTPSSPSPPYAEPEDIERQLEQFIAEQPGLAVASLSSVNCSATACEIALTGSNPNPRYVGAYWDLTHQLFAAPWSDVRILFGGISTREIAPGAREYVIGFEYQPLVDLSADPLIAARQYAACAAAWRRQTEIGPHSDDETRSYLDEAAHYVALAASVLGEREAERVAAETRGGPVIRYCGV